MKIFFCTPPSKIKPGPPLGIGYLAAVLEKANHQVFFQDGSLVPVKTLIKEIQAENPTLVGIYMNTVTRFDAISLAELIKDKVNLPIIIGGPHPTLMADQLLCHYDCFDYVLRGEAEESLVQLLDCLEKGQSLEKILGLSFRKNKQIVHNPPAPFIKDLDKLPFPKHEMFDYRRYPVPEQASGKDLMVVPVIASRGCPFNCLFCSASQLVGHTYRFRSAQNVIDEVSFLHQNLKANYIYFQDDHFFLNKKRTEEFCQGMIKKGLAEKVRWRCTGRVDCLDGPTLELMKKGGCDFICFGVESATEEGLKFFNKKFTLSQVRKVFAVSRRIGIRRGANFILGGDHETKETIEKQRQLIEELDPEIAGPSILTVFPGTDLFRLAKKKGLLDEKIWLERSPQVPFHNNVPLYSGPHLDNDTLIREAARITFWWNQMEKKNQFFSLTEGGKQVLGYVRAGRLRELKTILGALLKQYFSQGLKLVRSKLMIKTFL